jgi:hypothetical protein
MPVWPDPGPGQLHDQRVVSSVSLGGLLGLLFERQGAGPGASRQEMVAAPSPQQTHGPPAAGARGVEGDSPQRENHGLAFITIPGGDARAANQVLGLQAGFGPDVAIDRRGWRGGRRRVWRRGRRRRGRRRCGRCRWCRRFRGLGGGVVSEFQWDRCRRPRRGHGLGGRCLRRGRRQGAVWWTQRQEHGAHHEGDAGASDEQRCVRTRRRGGRGHILSRQGPGQGDFAGGPLAGRLLGALDVNHRCLRCRSHQPGPHGRRWCRRRPNPPGSARGG